jgi:hypothetical protein
VSPVRPLDQGEGFEGQDAEIASHLVGVTFDGVGLSGLEPLTSALSGEHGRRPDGSFHAGQGPASSTVVSWSPAWSSSSLQARWRGREVA